MSTIYIETRDQIEQLASAGYLSKALASFLTYRLFIDWAKGNDEPTTVINAVNAIVRRTAWTE